MGIEPVQPNICLNISNKSATGAVCGIKHLNMEYNLIKSKFGSVNAKPHTKSSVLFTHVSSVLTLAPVRVNSTWVLSSATLGQVGKEVGRGPN